MQILPWFVVFCGSQLLVLGVESFGIVNVLTVHSHYILTHLLFSLFIQIGRVEVTCFQSVFSDATTSHTRHEVPLDIIPCSDLQPTTLQALRSLPESLLAEERELLTLAQETSSNELQVTIHNSALYTAAICRLLDRICAPILRYAY